MIFGYCCFFIIPTLIGHIREGFVLSAKAWQQGHVFYLRAFLMKHSIVTVLCASDIALK